MDAGISKFFSIARERYQIKLNRDAGLPRPWSKDPIFQRNRFCNVFRESDKTTMWFRENIRDKVRDDPKAALLSIAAFRWFNKIEIGEVLRDSAIGLQEGKFNGNLAKARILFEYPDGPFVTGAYIMKTPNGMNKLDGVLWCIETFEKRLRIRQDFSELLVGRSSMEDACTKLQESPFLGRFSSYQICADAQHTCLLENAPDIMTWAQPGPGSTRGIGRVFYNDPDKFRYGSEKDEKEVIAYMHDLLCFSMKNELWPSVWPRWDMQTVQNWCCETDKYYRAEEGGHMKRKFNAA